MPTSNTRIEAVLPSWKSKTFTQITAGIKKNSNTTDSTTSANYFRSGPLKIYRREIASVSLDYPSIQRSAISITALDAPNGYTIKQTDISSNGVELTLNAKDANYTNNSTDHGATWVDSSSVCFTVASNALRRVRSSGMITRKFDAGRNSGAMYHTDTNQYLVSRNKTFSQNQYNYVKTGDSLGKPGSSLTLSNVYAPSGFSHCKKFYIAADLTFQYQWISGGTVADTTLTTVSVPVGYYDIYEINQLLRNTMDENSHYYKNVSTDTYVYLLNIAYNTDKTQIELQTYFSNQTIFPPSAYIPQGGNGDVISDTGTYCPYFVIPAGLAAVFGFAAGTYPANGGDIDTSVLATTDQTYRYVSSGNTTTMLMSVSTYTPQISGAPYKQVYYKPSNHQFANQGAVTGSSYITRKIYNAVSTNALKYLTVYGSSVANEMAYGINDSQRNTLKSRIGSLANNVPIVKVGANGVAEMSSTCRFRSRR